MKAAYAAERASEENVAPMREELEAIEEERRTIRAEVELRKLDELNARPPGEARGDARDAGGRQIAAELKYLADVETKQLSSGAVHRTRPHGRR